VPGTNSLEELLKAAMNIARENNFDVFNALDIMDNAHVF